jgi:hypothetical protein
MGRRACGRLPDLRDATGPGRRPETDSTPPGGRKRARWGRLPFRRGGRTLGLRHLVAGPFRPGLSGRVSPEVPAPRQDIDLKPNALASKWEDVDTLLGRGTLVAMKAGENTDRTAEFRAILATEKEADQNFGAAVRWAVQATNHGKLRLVLQGLPGGARRLQSEPLLTADEAEAIQLEAIDAEADLKEGGPCRGPIPVLFARDTDTVRTALELHPERVYTGTTKD